MRAPAASLAIASVLAEALALVLNSCQALVR